MSTRWLVIVVASVFVAVLAVALVLTRDGGGGPASVPIPSSSVSLSPTAPSSGSPSSSPTSGVLPSPSASPSTTVAASFSATGDVIAGWYWLRDSAHQNAATWEFTALPETGDLSFVVEVLATDAADGARGQQARFFFAWRASGAADWAGRLPVTLPNVSPPEDPVGYTCRGTVTLPRLTLGDASNLTVQISRSDVRGELPPTDVHVAVNASSVKLRLP